MKNGEKIISNILVERIYDFFEGHTWYIQNIFHRLFASMEKGEECTMQMIEQCVRSTVNSLETKFEGTLALLSERQKEMIYAIAKEGKAKEVTSSRFVRKHGLKSSSTVQSALRQLMEKEFITLSISSIPNSTFPRLKTMTGQDVLPQLYWIQKNRAGNHTWPCLIPFNSV